MSHHKQNELHIVIRIQILKVRTKINVYGRSRKYHHGRIVESHKQETLLQTPLF